MLVIPDDTTFLLMGTTPELQAALNALKATGVDRFTVETIGGGDPFMTKMGARTTSSDGGGLGYKHDVTVIALHSCIKVFDPSWTGIFNDMGAPTLMVDALLTELREIKKLKKV